MKKPELTAQILGMYIGRRANIEFKNYYTALDSDVITPASVGYFVLGDVDITPHLRRLESITEEECKGLFKVLADRNWALDTDEYTCKEKWWNALSIVNGMILTKDECIGVPTAWLYLLSKGFDLFGLIDAGLAKEVGE